jgi:hypothetical protein
MAQEVAVAEAAPIDRECRMIWHFVVKIEAAEPAVGEMRCQYHKLLEARAERIRRGASGGGTAATTGFLQSISQTS